MYYLLEIGTEELPAGNISKLLSGLQTVFLKKYEQFSLPAPTLIAYATPRRLALQLRDLPAQTESSTIILKGPAKDAPAVAVEGFMRKNNLSKEHLEIADGRYICERTLEPIHIAEVMKECASYALAEIRGDRWATWGAGDFFFARPVRWLVSLLNADIVELSAFGLSAGRYTRPNRLLEAVTQAKCKQIEIPNAADYAELLRLNMVEPDRALRQDIVTDELKAAEANIFPEVIQEVVDLVEWPSILIGHMDAKHCQNLPSMVIDTVLAKHQRHFSIPFTNRFAFVANCLPAANKRVIEGNQKVVDARLSDASFFLDEDLRAPLESRREALKGITFMKELEAVDLGSTMYDKALRLERIAGALAEQIFDNCEFTDAVRRAARLCKCDLMTKLVGEFPELQGKVGAYLFSKESSFLHKDGEIIRECLDNLYEDPIRIAGHMPAAHILSISDRLDNLFAAFLVGKYPSGSTDPYALRRQTVQILEGLYSLAVASSSTRPTYNFEFAHVAKTAFKNGLFGDEESFNEMFDDDKFSLRNYVYERMLFVIANKLKSFRGWSFPLPEPSFLNQRYLYIMENYMLVDSLIDEVQRLEALNQECSSPGGALAQVLDVIKTVARRLQNICKDAPAGEEFDRAYDPLKPHAYPSELEADLIQFSKGEGRIALRDLIKRASQLNGYLDDTLINDPANIQISFFRKQMLKAVFKRIDDAFGQPNWDEMVEWLRKMSRLLISN